MKKNAILLFLGLLGICQLIKAHQSDEYWYVPQGTFEERRTLFLDYYSEYGCKDWLYGIFRQVARIGAGKPLENELVYKAIDVMKSNHDCTDFTLHGFLRLMYLNKKKAFLPQKMREKIEERILDFKYWWDDARKDTTYRCYHTENHQGMYHAAELLAGQLYKKEKFANGMTGKQHIEHAIPLLEKWMEYRFRFGFAEWLSTYYDEDILFLVNLYDYAEDKRIRKRAEALLNLLFFDMALNNYQGMMGTTSGRMYANSLLSGSHNTSPITKLVFGVGTFDREEVLGTVVLALSDYRCPDIIREIATDYRTSFLSRQRVSINVQDAALYGLGYQDILDGHYYWSIQEFIHPMSIRLSKQISEKYDIWPCGSYDTYIERYAMEKKNNRNPVNLFLGRFALSEADIETYRTPYYMLSCVLDYRKGAPAYQQHVWQATLGNKAIVYTNHPGSKDMKKSPNYWSGNEILPKAVQFKNVAICMYNIPETHSTDFSHAYFPVDEFDEVHLNGHWLFGRKGDGYVALYSQHKAVLSTDMRGVLCDVIAKNRKNVWICEMGSREEWEDFNQFVKVISATEVSTNGLEVNYQSPTQGEISVGWDIPFKVDKKEQPTRWLNRYENPYCVAPFNSLKIRINKGDKELVINYN